MQSRNKFKVPIFGVLLLPELKISVMILKIWESIIATPVMIPECTVVVEERAAQRVTLYRRNKTFDHPGYHHFLLFLQSFLYFEKNSKNLRYIKNVDSNCFDTKKHRISGLVGRLTLSQTINFRPFQFQRLCRRQF